MTSHLTQLGVVVPAHDEEALLQRCLSHLDAAATRLAHEFPDITTTMVVVLDSCRDGSADVVARHPQFQALPIEARNAGMARQAGLSHLLDRAPDVGWFALTDADSAVPVDWLTGHVTHALRGTDLLLGTVHPDPADLTPAQVSAWASAHQLVDGHPHVHGANLGISRRAVDRIGGFAPLLVHEDVDLARRAKAAGLSWFAAGSIPVLTSGRITGRTPAGFAGYLRELVALHP